MSTGSPKSGGVQVRDAEHGRVAHMDRATMGLRVGLGGLLCLLDLLGGHGPHRYHQQTGEVPSRVALAIGDVHRHVAALLDVAHRQSGPQQGSIEAETAPEQHRHQVVPPPAGGVGGRVGVNAVDEQAVPGNIGAQVAARRSAHGLVPCSTTSNKRGNGLGLRAANSTKSEAAARGSTTKLACTQPGARWAGGPGVLPSPYRQPRRRAEAACAASRVDEASGSMRPETTRKRRACREVRRRTISMALDAAVQCCSSASSK